MNRNGYELDELEIIPEIIEAAVKSLRDSGRLRHEVEGPDQELVAAILAAAF